MSQVAIGAISDSCGFAASWETVESRHHGRNFDVRRTAWACPADRFRPTQPPDIPLEAGHHGPRIGTVQHLSYGGNGGKLWAVATVDDGYDLTRQPWQLSYDLNEAGDGLYDLNAVAVVDRSATSCMPLLEVREGALHIVAGGAVYQDPHHKLLRKAHEAVRARGRGAPVRVAGLADPDEEAQRHLAQQAGPLEYRSAYHVDTSPTQRLVEIVAAPYGVDAVVPVNGRMIRESFSNTAFSSADPDRQKIFSTREHDPARLVGRVTRLDWARPDGLLAEIRVARTLLGDETLTLVGEGLLDASVGFHVPAGGDQWEGRNRRRVTRALLREVSFVADAAYAGTGVVSVR